jgi:uncharacterized protein (DUF2267 family)
VDVTQRFITMVEQRSGLDRAAAESAARAVLDAFLPRLSGGEARDLARVLPPHLVRPVDVLADRRSEPDDLEGFLHRIAEAEGVDLDAARNRAEAVLTALRVVAGATEFGQAVAQLPADYRDLLDQLERPHVEVRSFVEFLARVGDRAGVDGGRARRASDAVLQTLGERIAADEATRLTGRLPAQLRGPLERGAAQTTATRRLPADKFVSLVAEREDATPQQARLDTRAVLTTVAAAVPEQDFYETIVLQLPDDYAELLEVR